ncbi:MAG: acetyl-CoA C-acetyltransferase [Candidatus Jordarchaeum sp.]|uniref:acetyl-CoA C-acetyltransferase n=1 Tax=Candidatus Jordarchaeum sp. TaxID=2823881 RepID=UPI00404B7B5E
MVEEVYIVDYLRSPFSRSRPTAPEKDVFNKVYMSDVVAMLINKIIKRTGINPKEIGDVLTGCTMQMKENWMYGGRVVNLLAGLPINVPAQAIDRVCISAMSAMHQGIMEIMLGYSDIVFANGMEHMTHLPMQLDLNPHLGVSPTLMKPEFIEKYDLFTAMSMGLTAEKLFAKYKDKYNWTRKEMDEFGVRSHLLAAKAQEEGYFTNGQGYPKGRQEGEIMPVEAEMPDGSKQIMDADQSIRADTTLEAVEQLKPVFKPDGVITAGNSSPLNAGATSMLLMSKKKMKEYGLEPMAKIVSMGWAGVDPSVMGEGPVPATNMALKHAGLKVKDIDFWEINEAFAIVTLYAIKALGLDMEKVNTRGGAIAIGHPLGSTGVRLTGTLARILEIEDAKYGCATLCGGGGQGGATIIERV